MNINNAVHNLVRTTISIYTETKARFKKVKGALMAKNGKEHDDDETLNILLDHYLRSVKECDSYF